MSEEEKCKICTSTLEEKTERQRDAIGNWVNKTFLYCNVCRNPVDFKKEEE